MNPAPRPSLGGLDTQRPITEGQIIGQSAGTTTLTLAFGRMEGKLWRTVRLRDMARAAARFANLPTLGVGAALLSNAGRFAPALLVAVLYGAQVAGWFALAQRILAAPVYVSSNAVARVYLSEAPRRARAEGTGIYKLFKTTTWRLLAFGVLALGLLIIAGPQLFGLIFGPVWTEAGRYAQFLALKSLGQLVVGPISQTLTVLERQDLQLGSADALRFAVLLLVFLAAHQLAWSPLMTIAVLSAAMTLGHVVLFVLTRRVLLAHVRAHRNGASALTQSQDSRRPADVRCWVHWLRSSVRWSRPRIALVWRRLSAIATAPKNTWRGLGSSSIRPTG